jgi:hypothetical protein
MLRGNLERVTARGIAGWARHDEAPGAPVSLVVTIDDEFAGRVIANRYRDDLLAAGIGNGRHAFALDFEAPLPPSGRHVIRVRREPDAADLPGSPFTLEPAPNTPEE